MSTHLTLVSCTVIMDIIKQATCSSWTGGHLAEVSQLVVAEQGFQLMSILLLPTPQATLATRGERNNLALPPPSLLPPSPAPVPPDHYPHPRTLPPPRLCSQLQHLLTRPLLPTLSQQPQLPRAAPGPAVSTTDTRSSDVRSTVHRHTCPPWAQTGRSGKQTCYSPALPPLSGCDVSSLHSPHSCDDERGS